ncbi:MAG: hypothetical protein ABJA98_06225 [Acidobacteriota bacterium]
MEPTASLDTRCYQAALYLCPPAFRREFSQEIVRVFHEARHDTQVASPRGGLCAFWARMSADLAVTIVRQWLRTAWPFIVVISMLYPLMAASAIAKFWRRASALLPRATADADVILLVLLTAVVIVVIAATIILTLWFTRPMLYRRRV